MTSEPTFSSLRTLGPLDILERLYQFDRQSEFQPRAHLYILTDECHLSAPLSHVMADLSHTCLTTYFYPHASAVNVSWTRRQLLKDALLRSAMQDSEFCIVDRLDNTMRMRSSLQFDDVDAVLFLSNDARRFLHVHSESFVDTLAVILQTTSRRVLKMPIELKPDCV
ncbi:hypothetical protein DPMN_112904 [Dreissena polymorpha]|uniref:Uncharacterized protein n=2 Tax=Dreissena polymorpha TaxID=45954 RepID=A0A9D4QQF9_DREPO|nr:hypothetical protein DPMN_112904 [Dreissena polymorpha]